MRDQIFQEDDEDFELENRYRLNDIVRAIFMLAPYSPEIDNLSKPPRPEVFYILTGRINYIYKLLDKENPEGWNVLKQPQKSYLDQQSVELILEQLLIKFSKDRKMNSRLRRLGIELNEETILEVRKILFSGDNFEPSEM